MTNENTETSDVADLSLARVARVSPFSLLASAQSDFPASKLIDGFAGIGIDERGRIESEKEREVKSAKGVASKSRINQGRSSNKGREKSIDRHDRVEKKKTAFSLIPLCKFSLWYTVVDGHTPITPAFSEVN